MMALLAALVGFSHVLVGFQNRQLVALVASLLSQPYGHRQATYDLRRLRRKADLPIAAIAALSVDAAREVGRRALPQGPRQGPVARSGAARSWLCRSNSPPVNRWPSPVNFPTSGTRRRLTLDYSGGMFWLKRNTLPGSNRAFNACRRANFCGPNTARRRSTGAFSDM